MGISVDRKTEKPENKVQKHMSGDEEKSIDNKVKPSYKRNSDMVQL